MEPYAKLLVSLKDRELEFILNKENMTIGRGVNQSIVINEPTISRLHARIFLRDGSYFLEDLSTFQKTYLNKAPMQIPMNLNHRDVIQLGNVKALFLTSHLPPDDESLNEIRYSFQGNYNAQVGEESYNMGDFGGAKTNEKYEAPQELKEEENIKKATQYLKADIEDILDDEEEIEIEDSPLATGESLDMPFSEIPFANVITYAKQSSSLKSKIKDAQLFCENTQQELTITKEAIYVGLDAINEMKMNDSYFSKVHFAIMFNQKSSKYYLKNMGDKEIRCNGVPIENMFEMGNYAIINTGEYRFHFLAGTQDVIDFQKMMIEEHQDFSVRFLPELPTDTVILDSSALQIKGEYQVMGADSDVHATIFFVKNIEGDRYVFCGEIFGDKDDLPSTDLNTYTVKLQGVFETILDYEGLPAQIMEDFNRIIYSRFKGIKISGTLIRFHRDEITWIGDGLCSPIFYTAKTASFLPSIGVSLGMYERFAGYEQQTSWKLGDKILFFTKSMLNYHLKGQTLVMSIDSLKRLFSKKLQEKGFSLASFCEELTTKVDISEKSLLALFSRAEVN